MDGGKIVEAKGLTKQFASKNAPPVTALDSLDLSLARGRLTAVIGPDGAGIRIIPEGYPALLIILPFGGFITLGLLIALIQRLSRRSAEKAETEEAA